MNFSKRNKSIVDFLFILALFGAFAITGLFVVIFGARIYEKTVSHMDENYSSRTALSYVTEKIRAHDVDGGIRIGSENIDSKGYITVLKLYETVNDRRFVTYLYLDEGYLKEYTTDENYDFNYEGGTKIIEAKAFDAQKISDALYHIDIKDSYDEETSFYVTVYSGIDGEELDE